jgi:hypothetical protein
VMSDGSIACWGDSGGGYSATVTPPTGTFSSVSAGGPSACAVNSADHSIACWYLPVETSGGY